MCVTTVHFLRFLEWMVLSAGAHKSTHYDNLRTFLAFSSSTTSTSVSNGSPSTENFAVLTILSGTFVILSLCKTVSETDFYSSSVYVRTA